MLMFFLVETGSLSAHINGLIPFLKSIAFTFHHSHGTSCIYDHTQ